MNLENLNVTELGAQEKVETDGGVPWWLYIINPGGAYLIDKFQDGVSETCPPCGTAMDAADAMVS